MDLRGYYKEIRDMEASIPTPYTVIASVPTSHGGKAGVITEVPRLIAARMIVEQSARLATDQEAADFYQKHAAQRQAEAEAQAAAKVKVILAEPVVPAASATKDGKQK
jgi:hypothetical protein